MRTPIGDNATNVAVVALDRRTLYPERFDRAAFDRGEDPIAHDEWREYRLVFLENFNYVSPADAAQQEKPLTLDELLAAISLIGKHKRIIGVDVCGDGSPFVGKERSLKRLVAWIEAGDIPAADFSSPEKLDLNETVNLKILERLAEAMPGGSGL